MKPRFFERLSLFAVLVCFALLCAVGARAQETGDIVGTVTDSTGAVVPNATVTLTNTLTNVTQTAQTAGDGNYLFTLLQVGTYVVKVQASGFKTATNPPIALSSGDRARVDVKLEVGEQTTTVEVQAAVAPALQTDTSNVGQITPSQSVEDLPLNGRNLIQLVFATPGVTSGSPGSIVQGNRPDDRRLISSFSVNGQTDTMNNNMIDGMDNNERIIGTIGVRPSIDAVQELNVQTNKYDASVGRTGGGVVDVITKSGTNSYHGSAYEFFRNKVLNTNPNYNFNEALNLQAVKAGMAGASDPHTVAAANPSFQQNQFGGSIGGPIKKDKTFFFADFEQLNYNTGTTAAFYSVPTMCERGLVACPDGMTMNNATTGYDFSDNPSVSQPLSQQAGGTSSACSSAASAVGTNLQYGSTHCPYVIVPVGSTTPLGRAYFNMYPLPNTGAANAISNNYTSAPVKRFKSDTYDGRVDEHINDKNTLYGRYTHNGETTLNPNGFPSVSLNPATGALGGSIPVTPVVLAYAGPNNEVQDALAFSYVHVYNSNLLLNLKAGAFRSAIISEPANNNTDVSNKLWGFCNPSACVNAEGQTKGVIGSGLATISVSPFNSAQGLTGIGDTSFIPLLEFDTTFQYMGTVTWNHGPHSVRVGISLIRRRATIGQSNNPQGTFTFNGSFTGVAAGDLLEGLNSTISRNNALDQPGFRTWEPGIFVQDDWRARPWLTLNVGMRYDIFSAYTEVHGRMSNYDPYLGLVESPAIPGIQQSSNTAGVPTPLRDFAPRLGFAATLHHNMVLRGGFGLTYFPVNYESPYYMKNQPFGYTATCGLQSSAGTVNSCASAQFNGAAGQFNSGIPTNYATTGTSSTAYNYTTAPSCTLGTTVGCGGAFFAGAIPTPVLNIALATNPATYAGQSVASVPINLQENYLEQFNLELQKQFGANVVNLGYVGQRGVHVAPLNSGTNQNLPANPTENVGGTACVAGTSTLPLAVGGNSYAFGALPGFPCLNTTSVAEEANIGTSFYNAMQASLVRRFSHGLTVNFNYVWSKMLDNVDGNRACVLSIFATPEPCWFDAANGAGTVIAGTPPTAYFNKTQPVTICATAGPSICKNVLGWQQADWGTGTQDVPNRFSWGLNYQIPFGSSLTGIEGAIVKGWAVNTTGSWQTGLPFSVSPSLNNSGISGAGYLDQTCSGKGAHPSLLNWYNENCFVQATPGLLGDERPNQLRGPSQKRVDASLFKEFPIKEQIKMQFRAEVFNLFNQVNFNTPNATLAFSGAGPTGVLNSVGPNIGLPGSSHVTGEVTAVNANWSQREIQFALKLIF